MRSTHHRIFPAGIVFAAAAVFAPALWAEDPEMIHLFGLERERAEMNEYGVAFDAVNTTDLTGNISGGAKRGAPLLSVFDLSLSVDSGKAGLWQNGTLFFNIFAAAGEQASRYVGDIQGTDNWDCNQTVRINDFWYEHSFFDGSFSLRAGIDDINNEFNLLSHAALLMNGSFGITPELGLANASTYPNTTAGVRARLTPVEPVYLLAALFDGTPGDADRTRGTHIRFDGGDGVFSAVEAGVEAPGEDDALPPYKAGLGLWYNTGHGEDFAGQRRSWNRGLYAIGEAALLREEDPGQGLGAFLQLGWASRDRNQITQYFGAGLDWVGPIPSRDEDALSLGIAHARNGSDYHSAMAPEALWAEAALELTYSAEVKPCLTLQPDLQYVINPGTTRTRNDAWVLRLRAQIVF